MSLLLGHLAAGSGEPGGQKGIKVSGRRVHHGIGHAGGKGFEGLVLGHEVGFGIDFDQNPDIAASGGDHRPLGGDPAGFFGGCRQPLLAQDIDRLVHVAAGFGQSFFAIHHPGAGFGPQLGNHRCSNICHNVLLIFAGRAVGAEPSFRTSCRHQPAMFGKKGGRFPEPP
jgi:hypothetical protein